MTTARIYGAGFVPVRSIKPDYAIKLTERNLVQASFSIQGTVTTLDNGVKVIFLKSQYEDDLIARVGDYVVMRSMFPKPVPEVLSEQEYVRRYGSPLP